MPRTSFVRGTGGRGQGSSSADGAAASGMPLERAVTRHSVCTSSTTSDVVPRTNVRARAGSSSSNKDGAAASGSLRQLQAEQQRYPTYSDAAAAQRAAHFDVMERAAVIKYTSTHAQDRAAGRTAAPGELAKDSSSKREHQPMTPVMEAADEAEAGLGEEEDLTTRKRKHSHAATASSAKPPAAEGSSQPAASKPGRNLRSSCFQSPATTSHGASSTESDNVPAASTANPASSIPLLPAVKQPAPPSSPLAATAAANAVSLRPVSQERQRELAASGACIAFRADGYAEFSPPSPVPADERCPAVPFLGELDESPTPSPHLERRRVPTEEDTTILRQQEQAAKAAGFPATSSTEEHTRVRDARTSKQYKESIVSARDRQGHLRVGDETIAVAPAQHKQNQWVLTPLGRVMERGSQYVTPVNAIAHSDLPPLAGSPTRMEGRPAKRARRGSSSSYPFPSQHTGASSLLPLFDSTFARMDTDDSQHADDSSAAPNPLGSSNAASGSNNAVDEQAIDVFDFGLDDLHDDSLSLAGPAPAVSKSKMSDDGGQWNAVVKAVDAMYLGLDARRSDARPAATLEDDLAASMPPASAMLPPLSGSQSADAASSISMDSIRAQLARLASDAQRDEIATAADSECVQVLIQTMASAQPKDGTMKPKHGKSIRTIFDALLQGVKTTAEAAQLQGQAMIELARVHYTMTSECSLKHQTASQLICQTLDSIAEQLQHASCQQLARLARQHIASAVRVIVKNYAAVGASSVEASFICWKALNETCAGSMLSKLKYFGVEEILRVFQQKVKPAERFDRLKQAWCGASDLHSINSSDDWRKELGILPPFPKPKPSQEPPPPLQTESRVVFSLIIVYSDMKSQSNDPWTVIVKSEEERVKDATTPAALHDPAFKLLNANPNLLLQLQRDEHGVISSRVPRFRAGKQSARPRHIQAVHIGEYALADLHTIHELHQLVQRCSEGSKINVVFVPSSAVEDAMRVLAGEPLQQQRVVDSDTRPLLASELLNVPDSNAQKTVHYSFAESWKQALEHVETSGAPLRTVYARTLMWFNEFATEHTRQRLFSQLLQNANPSAAPAQFPPNAINEVYDDKRANASMFEKFMLPQQWFDIPQRLRDGSSDALLRRLEQIKKGVQHFAQKCGTASAFVLKGAHATCETAFLKLTRAELTDRRLDTAVRKLVLDLKQHCIGIQPFSAALRGNEYRVLMQVQNKFGSNERLVTQVATVKTHPYGDQHCQGRGPAGEKGLNASLPDPAGDEAVKCQHLVLDMLNHPAAQTFFHKLRYDEVLGLPALRIDTFIDENGCAKLNELAPTPDAVLFTSTHDSSLVSKVGIDTAHRIWRLATGVADVEESIERHDAKQNKKPSKESNESKSKSKPKHI